MKYIFSSSISLLAFILTFLLQNILLLTEKSLLYIYEGFSAVSLYASLCALYFSLKFFEEKRGRKSDFLFAKVFFPAPVFSFTVIFNINFNFLSIFSSVVCFLLVSASLIFILIGFFSATVVPGVGGGFDRLNHHESSDISSFSDIFSEREMAVADLILQGKTAQETADALFVSLSTVKTHIQHIYEKANVHNRAAFARWAQNHTKG